MESEQQQQQPQHGNEPKPKDRLVGLLDQIEVHVEQLRKDASRLEEEKDTLLTTLDTLRNNDMLFALEERECSECFSFRLITFSLMEDFRISLVTKILECDRNWYYFLSA